MLETDDCRRGLRNDDLTVGLVEVIEDKLFHVADAGSFGGGI
jgi:hypothetical protein